MPKSQMRSVMRRSELAHERQKTNLAEPLVSKSWLRCTDKNFADFAKNGVFQHNRLVAAVRCTMHIVKSWVVALSVRFLQVPHLVRACSEGPLSADFAKNGVFQHNQPNVTDAAACLNGSFPTL